MGYRIEIVYDEQRMEANRRRLEAVRKFSYADRVPVVLGVEARLPLHARGVGFLEYFSSPERQVFHQIMNQKWILENIPDDRCVSPSLQVYPDFQNVLMAGGLGAEIVWQDDIPPLARPIFHSPSEVWHFKPPGPRDNLWGVKIKWFQEMQRLVKDYEIYFNGVCIPVEVIMGPPNGTLTSTVTALAGSDFYWWIREYPKECHLLLRMVTDAIIAWETEARRFSPKEGMHTGEDAGQLLSVQDFQEFVVPYLLDLYRTFPGERGIHMCGSCAHLLPILRDKLAITHFNGFGRDVEPEVMARELGGRVQINGNVDPMLLLTGTKEEVFNAAMRVLSALGPKGGFILSDGYNLCPGTSRENLIAMVEAAESFGLPVLLETANYRGEKATH